MENADLYDEAAKLLEKSLNVVKLLRMAAMDIRSLQKVNDALSDRVKELENQINGQD